MLVGVGIGLLVNVCGIAGEPFVMVIDFCGDGVIGRRRSDKGCVGVVSFSCGVI